MKKTKFLKLISLLAFGLVFNLNMNAQDQVSGETLVVGNENGNNPKKTTRLTVTVGEFYSLNLSSDNALILLDDESKFAMGSKSTPITMSVFSSRKYSVSAQVNSAIFNDVAEGTTVNTDNINLLVTKTSGNVEAKITNRENKSLKHISAEDIVSSNKATKEDIYSLVYEIPEQNTAAFLDQYGKTISTQITYTLLPL